MTLSKLKQGTSLAGRFSWASQLAREDKLSFTQAGKIVRLSLRTSQTA